MSSASPYVAYLASLFGDVPGDTGSLDAPSDTTNTSFSLPDSTGWWDNQQPAASAASTASSDYSVNAPGTSGGGMRAPSQAASPWNSMIQSGRQQSLGSQEDSVSGWLSRLTAGDKTTNGQAKLGIGALGMLGSLLQSRKSRNSLTPAQLQAMLKSPYSSWTPDQQTSFNNYFYKPLPNYVKPAQPQGLAVGGQLMNPQMASMQQMGRPQNSGLPWGQFNMPQQPISAAMARGGEVHSATCGCASCGGALRSLATGGSPLVQGTDPGQSDRVNVNVSPGEYVMDADVVSALGDGNNAAGAKALDVMRENIRAHKRAAPASRIPPKARSPLDYLKVR